MGLREVPTFACQSSSKQQQESILALYLSLGKILVTKCAWRDTHLDRVNNRRGEVGLDAKPQEDSAGSKEKGRRTATAKQSPYQFFPKSTKGKRVYAGKTRTCSRSEEKVYKPIEPARRPCKSIGTLITPNACRSVEQLQVVKTETGIRAHAATNIKRQTSTPRDQKESWKFKLSKTSKLVSAERKLERGAKHC